MFKPIISSSFFGVNIALEGFLQRFNLSPLTALLVPFFIAVIVLILSLNHDYEKKISNMIALFSIFFFAYYIFLWSQSSWMYFGSIADASLQFGYVFAGIILYLFMFMTIFFYIAGYLFLLSETIAELVNEKWSNPVDEEIKLLRRKLRRR
jgi:predicted membrane protein